MKKLAFVMVLILLMSLMVAPVYAAPAVPDEPSVSRDEEIGIDDGNTPLGETPEDPGTDIGDNDTPLGEDPGDTGMGDDGVDIDDGDVPLVSSPQTGEGSMDVVLVAAAVLCMAGVATVAMSKKKAA